MRMDLIGALFLIAMAIPASAFGADDFTNAGMEIIREELGPNCPAKLKTVGEQLYGNNGLREEQWFVETCQGFEQYQVTYYPPKAFPSRTTYLVVQKITYRVR